MRSLRLLVALALVLPLATAVPLPVEPPHAAATHHVHMMTVAGAAFLYDPAVLQVAVGDIVVFHSHDIHHSATSGLLTETEVAEAAAPAALHLNSFNSGQLPAGTSASVGIGEVGAYPYYCTVGFHRLAGMHGLILAS